MGRDVLYSRVAGLSAAALVVLSSYASVLPAKVPINFAEGTFLCERRRFIEFEGVDLY
jgi:hypothetical protein